MKTIKILLLPLLFVISSCYIYKPYQYKEIEQSASKSTRPGGAASFRNSEGKIENNRAEMGLENPNDKKLLEEKLKEEKLKEEKKMIEKKANEESNAGFNNRDGNAVPAKSSFSQNPNGNANTESEGISVSSEIDSIKIKIQPTKYYKITVEEKQYKIQADQWEEDTLVSHILRKPKKVLRFHKDQIDEEALLERRFSKPFSDLFTVGAYVAGGAAVLLLVL